MSKPENKGLVPERRFSEFRGKEEWTKNQLGQCLSRHPEYGINAPAVPYSDNLPRYLRITDISEDGEIRQDQKVSVAKGVTDENYLDDGDVVLARTGASVGKAYKYRLKDGKLVFAGFLIRVKPDTRKLNSELLFQFLSTEQYWHWVNLTSARSGQPGINGNEYSLLPIPLPPTLNEQQKIADCLTSIDELIAAQTQKLDALKTHKKGLMQQLFPAEGETVPKLRFPDFRHAEEWEDGFIRDLGEIITGSTPSTTKPEYYGGNRLFVSPADISDQRFIEKTKTTLTELGFSETRPVKPGSILFVCIGSTIGKIAQNHHECATNQQINAVVPSANYSNAFVYYSLENNSEKISGLAGNHAVPIINKTAFGAVEIRFPKQPEQQKIADCLTSIDELITAQTQKIEALKAYKKGLMQQLFPAMDFDCMDAKAEIDA